MTPQPDRPDSFPLLYLLMEGQPHATIPTSIYRTKPFSTPIPNQMKPLNPTKNGPIVLRAFPSLREISELGAPSRLYNHIGGTLCRESTFDLGGAPEQAVTDGNGRILVVGK